MGNSQSNEDEISTCTLTTITNSNLNSISTSIDNEISQQQAVPEAVNLFAEIDPSTYKKQFLSIGLDEKTATSASTSKVAKIFSEIINESGVTGNDKLVANMLYSAASKLPSTPHRATIVKYIANKSIKTAPQLDAAVKYLKKAGADTQFNTAGKNIKNKINKKIISNMFGNYINDINYVNLILIENLDYIYFVATEFEKFTGIGVVITAEQIHSTINRIIDSNLTQLKEERYRMAGKLIATINSELVWGDGALIKKIFDEKLLSVIGEKTEEDTKKVKPSKDAPVVVKKEEKTEEKPAEINWLELLDGREIPEARNTEAHLAHHKKVSNGCPITRFPPEPNGYLHIGTKKKKIDQL
jgi:hypothetical protein